MRRTLRWARCLGLCGLAPFALGLSGGPAEAPAGFDGLTNGFATQAQFDLDREQFDERESLEEGLGPIYNTQSCGECHQNPVSGGSSQITEVRAGHFDGQRFVDHQGGSLVNERAIDPAMQERVTGSDNVRALRVSPNTLGDGLVEALADETLKGIAAHQPVGLRGVALLVPVGEAGGALRIGRFGWKDQHASLLSFAADAYLNEMGITSPLEPHENSAEGRSVDDYDSVPDPELPATVDAPYGVDIEAVARFMRATKAPPRDGELAATSESQAGERLFAQIGCSVCHVPTLVTAPAGTAINGGTFTIPEALGSKRIHPFSDFLMHDVGTGDGIVQNGGPASRNLIRTAPLWGLRARTRLMHDGQSLTRNDAILRHSGQAAAAAAGYRRLSRVEKAELIAFLNSL